MRIHIPGMGNLALDHLVLDFTGTLSIGGYLIPGVAERLKVLSEQLKLYVLTADTFGKVRHALDGLPVEITVMNETPEDRFKEKFVELKHLEQTLGRTGRLAVAPILRWSRRDLWQFHMLDQG